MVVSPRGVLQSPGMQDAVRQLLTAISTGGGVLFCGEPGTGGELFARAMHRATYQKPDGSVEYLLRSELTAPSPPAGFVAVDCAQLDDAEMHLFGGEAIGSNDHAEELECIGVGSALYRALGGTLFLGQITELPRRSQERLGRILRDGDVRVSEDGRMTESAGLVKVRLRLVGSVEPSSAVADGLSRDLRKRMATVIQLPPLRERREDIPAIVRALLVEICARNNVPVKRASTQATELLSALPWRGNVDELRRVLRGLVARVPGGLIRLRDVLGSVRLDGRADTSGYGGTLREARDRFEREYVAHVLEQHHGRMAEAAKALGIQRTNLYRKVRQLAVRRRRPGGSSPLGSD